MLEVVLTVVNNKCHGRGPRVAVVSIGLTQHSQITPPDRYTISIHFFQKRDQNSSCAVDCHSQFARGGLAMFAQVLLDQQSATMELNRPEHQIGAHINHFTGIDEKLQGLTPG